MEENRRVYKMIVLLAGMQRSGSTFAFNVVRELLRARGYLYQESSNDMSGAMERGTQFEHILLKTHDGDQSAIDLAMGDLCFTICTVRPVVDAVASWMVTFDQPEDLAIQHMLNWLRFYKQIQSHALSIPYDLVEQQPQIAITRIVQHLKIEAASPEIDAIGARLAKETVMREVLRLSRDDPHVEDIGFSYYDRESFFHRRHVTSLSPILAEDRLSPDQIARIESALREEIAGCSDAKAMLIGPS